MSRLVISGISGLSVNTWTANDKYSFRNKENLAQSFQMHLFKRRKKISEFFAAFVKSTSNFEHFEKKDEPHSLCISEIRNWKGSG